MELQASVVVVSAIVASRCPTDGTDCTDEEEAITTVVLTRE